MHAILSRDYLDLKIDTERHLNGAEVASRLRQGEEGGIPWTVVTDSTGAALITSDGPEGNIGCPGSESETAWFMEMISKTARSLDEAAIAKLDALLEEFAKQYRR